MVTHPAAVSGILFKLGETVRSSMVRFWTGLVSDRPDRYQPERHYMRGPGPKWREKHSAIRIP